jgi:hypothetical protein
MPSKFTIKPDKKSAEFIKSRIRVIRSNGELAGVDKEEIDKEVRKFKKVYLTVLSHAMGKLDYEREEAEEYALNTCIDKAADWAVTDRMMVVDESSLRLPIMIESLDLSDDDILSLVESMQKNINIFCVK